MIYCDFVWNFFAEEKVKCKQTRNKIDDAKKFNWLILEKVLLINAYQNIEPSESCYNLLSFHKAQLFWGQSNTKRKFIE